MTSLPINDGFLPEFCSWTGMRCGQHSRRDCDPSMLGFRKGCQRGVLVTYARVLVEGYREWSRQALICQADFARAYDSVKHAEIHECKERSGVMPPVIAAYIRDLRSARLVFKQGLLGDRRSRSAHRLSRWPLPCAPSCQVEHEGHAGRAAAGMASGRL